MEREVAVRLGQQMDSETSLVIEEEGRAVKEGLGNGKENGRGSNSVMKEKGSCFSFSPGIKEIYRLVGALHGPFLRFVLLSAPLPCYLPSFLLSFSSN